MSFHVVSTYNINIQICFLSTANYSISFISSIVCIYISTIDRLKTSVPTTSLHCCSPAAAAGLLDLISSGRESNEETTRLITDLDLPILYILQGFRIVLAFNCSVFGFHCHSLNVGICRKSRKTEKIDHICMFCGARYFIDNCGCTEGFVCLL